jgi:hypothetical protein
MIFNSLLPQMHAARSSIISNRAYTLGMSSDSPVSHSSSHIKTTEKSRQEVHGVSIWLVGFNLNDTTGRELKIIAATRHLPALSTLALHGCPFLIKPSPSSQRPSSQTHTFLAYTHLRTASVAVASRLSAFVGEADFLRV